MTTQGTNLFIVDDNKFTVEELKHCLKNKFGESLKISTFYDGDSCLQKVDENTQIVILDYFMEGKDGLETLKSIKAINPKTEVVMLTGNENIAFAIETFRMGAKDYVIKGAGSWKKIIHIVDLILTEPLRLLTREFDISKYMAIFLLTFITMAILVLYGLNKLQ